MGKHSKRGILWCNNPDCKIFQKSCFVFVDSYGKSNNTGYCHVCKSDLKSEWEYLKIINPHMRLYEVIINFGFDVATEKYKVTAIIRNDLLIEGKICVLNNPIIQTHKRALYLAEKIFSNLTINPEPKSIRDLETEFILNFEDMDFSKKLNELYSKWNQMSSLL